MSLLTSGTSPRKEVEALCSHDLLQTSNLIKTSPTCVQTIWITAKKHLKTNLRQILSLIHSSSLAGVLNLLKYIAL